MFITWPCLSISVKESFTLYGVTDTYDSIIITQDLISAITNNCVEGSSWWGKTVKIESYISFFDTPVPTKSPYKGALFKCL